MEKKVTVIALTGGPCGGKTSVLAELEQQLSDRGVAVVTVPEQARQLIHGGLHPGVVPAMLFQKGIMASCYAAEDIFRRLAAQLSAPQVVMICDRGIPDSAAYLEHDEFNQLLAREGLHLAEFFARYDAAIHLVTAADGAEEFYVNDAERRETPAQARDRDRRTQHAWTGHPHLRVIDNSTDLAGKKRRVVAEILNVLGLPVPLEIERKFELVGVQWDQMPLGARTVFIEQAYLPTATGGEERIRRRVIDNHAVHYRTIKRLIRSGVREEREWHISEQEYADAYAGRLKEYGVIRKYRWCFLHEGQYFELDDFSPMGLKSLVLELELTDVNDDVAIPSWLVVRKEVTHDPAFSNYEIARKVA